MGGASAPAELRTASPILVWRSRAVATTTTSALRPHLPGIGLLVLVTLWLARRLLFTSALPAGTDMLDVLARTQQNADWHTLLSPWSPSGLGLARQTSLDNALGLLTLATGDAVLTVKLLLVALLLCSGLSAYWLVWRWYGELVPAALAGLLYMTSQASLGRVASGWLHYEALIAAAPLLLYLWVALLDGFRLRQALTFALLVSAIVFARQDMILWLVPALALYVPVRLVTSRDIRPALLDLGKTTAVVVPTVLALSLYLIVPVAGGIHAPWLSTGQVFEAIRFNLLDRSLGAYQSLLGLGRDLGYLPFNGEAWWNFHPWLPTSAYYAFVGAVVVAALGAVVRYRDRRTVYLFLCAAVAAFLGKGIRGPFGEPYWWAVEHVPVFGNLRGPNRWLIVQALAYSVLASLTFHRVYLHVRARHGGALRPPFSLAGAGLAAAVCLALLPVAPTLVSGLRTWEPSGSNTALMRSLQADRTQAPVVSVPYGQSMRFLTQPGYSGWEHDLGVESPLYTHHPALSTNSWDRRGSDFVDFTSSLLRERAPAFTELLASVGAKYALRFDYPAESARSAGGPFLLAQQRSLAAMPGASLMREAPSGGLYRLARAAPLVSFRTNIAVVLDGREGLAALAGLQGVHLSDWAAYTADDLLTGGGSLTRLLRAIRTSDLVLVSGSSLNDLAVLASTPVARVAGITSDPGLDRKVGLLLTDETARRGSLGDQSIAPPALVAHSSATIELRRPERLELWVRVLASRDAGAVTASIDGRRVGRLVPLEPGSGGFRWWQVTTQVLAAGTHTVDLQGARSAYGETFEVDEARLVRPADRRSSLQLLERELAVDPAKIAYSVDLSTGPYTNVAQAGAGTSRGPFWVAQDPLGISARHVEARGQRYDSFRLTGTRRFYTVATHVYPRPQSWAGRSYAVVRYRGTGSGARYDLLVDFNERRTRFASVPLVDGRAGWQTVTVPVKAGSGNWKHVVSLRVATKAKDTRGSLELGSVRLLFPSVLLKEIRLPGAPGLQPSIVGYRGQKARVTLTRGEGTTLVRTLVPSSLARAPGRLVIEPARPLPARPATHVEAKTDGAAGYSYSLTAPRRGVLVFDQTFDPRWRLTDRVSGTELRSTTPVTSLVNGYLLGRGAHAGSVAYAGRELVWVGALLSVLALVAVVGLIAWSTAVERRSPLHDERRFEPVASLPQLSRTDIERAVLTAGAALAVLPLSTIAAVVLLVGAAAMRSAGWWRPWISASVLVLAAPAYVLLGRPDMADRAAVAAVFCLLAALVRLLLANRRAVRA